MAISGSEQDAWQEIDARGPNDEICHLWNSETGKHKVIFKLPVGIIETIELPFAEAREDFLHPGVTTHLGSLTAAGLVREELRNPT